MAITTRDDLHDYILRQLGEPLVQVELVSDHIDDSINESIKLFSEFAFDGELEETVILTVDGSGVYDLPPAITAIMKVSQGGAGIGNFGANFGSGFAPDIWSEQFFPGSTSGIVDSILGISATRSQLDKFFGNDIYYDFNSFSKKLRLFEPYSGDLIVHYSKEYIPEPTDYIFDANWVKAYSVARARMLQSTITGKFDQALVGGARINYDNMRSLAEQELDRLKEELISHYAGPAPISIA